MFLTVQPGEFFDYDYQLPDDHPPGVYWYHPHHHGMVADQVFGGLYGAIVVEDPQQLPVTRERVLVVSDITLDASGRLQQPSTMRRPLPATSAGTASNWTCSASTPDASPNPAGSRRSCWLPVTAPTCG
ncbi:Multicopper oxidase [Modestobacter sp. DSM 44400]|uniref:multicopper oxidase domain-containing protein n=1 Tax=Modestobacter sp. DSM 44400 TaxID=1550230 RepID=UPI0008964612|nr:multicopper oxidase domain-containing protein [Modestobacter sp. DSM 44400]SDY80299.1 Multicopper oxidase [Modestobacter sp. DSM 44400]